MEHTNKRKQTGMHQQQHLTVRMMKTARKYNMNLAAIHLTPNLQAKLPAWYHIASNSCLISNAASKCLLKTHHVSKVADLMRILAKLREENIISHGPDQHCVCQDCLEDRITECRNPHICATEAYTRIQLIFPKFNPLLTKERHDNLSLTKRHREAHEAARTNNREITFNPSITSKDNLEKCFRIFTNPNKITNIPAKCLNSQGFSLNDQNITIYMDGACFNNGKANAKSGSGIWVGPNNPRNRAIRVPGENQSNQAREITAIILAASAVPPRWPLKIVTDSKYTINGLTKHLKEWEDNRWIEVKNAKLFKRAAYLLKKCTAPTTFQWVKPSGKFIISDRFI